ncbi:hypothetical protein R1sor_013149 [Riccia sorocarpa]|uniref:Cytochrome b5 heme-binding domain-containing protein n=1 Tax=Riccia sorocarpa TaxID=122646 RepID=A0ABD3H9A4_9MARC
MVTISEIESEDEGEKEPLVAETPSPSTSAPESIASPSYDPAGASRKVSESGDIGSWISMIFAVLLALVVLKLSSPTTMKPRLWRPDELAKYNGSDTKLPILVGIVGSVFDVSKGRKHYGPGGGYSHFSGRDASRAFVSGNFTADGLTDSLEGLSPLQVKSVMDWHNFFQNSTKYIYVGKLVGRFYNESGLPTKEFVRATRLAARGERITKERKEEEVRFPTCNSRWNPEEGGEVWCTTGYPRIVEVISDDLYRGTVDKRCACFDEKAMKSRKGLEQYEGCPPLSQKCQSSPPQV